MSKQDEVTVVGLGAPAVRCPPLTREPLSGQQAGELARAFKALGDPVRLRLLSLIASHSDGEACVCDLTDVFDLSGPTISHHLKVLRETGLVTSERRGTWVYYRARPDLLTQLSAVLVADDDGPGPPEKRLPSRVQLCSPGGVEAGSLA